FFHCQRRVPRHERPAPADQRPGRHQPRRGHSRGLPIPAAGQRGGGGDRAPGTGGDPARAGAPGWRRHGRGRPCAGIPDDRDVAAGRGAGAVPAGRTGLARPGALSMYPLARALLFRVDAERAHGLGLAALQAAWRSGTLGLAGGSRASFPVPAFGLELPSPVGLAAGLDKNGAHVDALLALGFGFVEVGTVTPRPQAGNPKRRMFRLPQHQAIINRLGFNNDGVDALVRNVSRARRSAPGLLGINIGRNRDTPNASAHEDYLHCMERVYPLADYLTVNISSPNTAGLRELQEE